MELALYVHIPFCLRKCLYCDFASFADAPVPPAAYVAALVREMELRAARLARPVTAATLYLGGGTPSLLAPELVAGVVAAARRQFSLSDAAEVTLEANPGTLTVETLAGFRAAGVNRLSLGVQSFDDRLLAGLGRIHTAREAEAAVHLARTAGFSNLGLDLIHGLPGQDPTGWERDLRRATALAPEHISAYALAVEEGTPFHRLAATGELALPPEEEAVRMFEQTSEVLTACGYEHYEIANFARPGYRSRHNQVYWQRGPYLGFGAAAHSFLPTPGWGIRWRNPADPAAYRAALDRGGLPAGEVTPLSRQEAMGEWFFLGLRLREGVDLAAFPQEFGLTVAEAFPGVLDRLAGQGLVEVAEDRLRLTPKGLLLANQVFLAFL